MVTVIVLTFKVYKINNKRLYSVAYNGQKTMDNFSEWALLIVVKITPERVEQIQNKGVKNAFESVLNKLVNT
jgi:hypothetical protein